AGLAIGYHLARQGLRFVILDAHERIGDAWRQRWDSLRLFTPARYDGLPGLPFPASAHSFPTKDEVADYLQAYAARFELPVRTGVRVDGLSRQGDRFVLTAGDRRFEADNVVVAMATHQVPWAPPFAAELDPRVVQLHAGEYRNPAQLQDGGVLVVGTGNSGAEIALDVASRHRTWLSGRDPHVVPFRIETVAARFLFHPLVRFMFHHVLTMRTPVGRKVRPKILAHGAPLVRVKPKDIAAAGIERVPKTVGVRDGRPVLEDERVLEAANVIWCTGFRPDFSWIDLPVFADEKEPRHERGIVADEPGLYFVGLLFLYAMSSATLPGVGRDAERIVQAVAARTRAARSVEERRPARPPAPSRLI
ncbi:MAG TPA: NAD(P)-binding domain-containing protein, partial [Methylomirabilota bacterium]|nr:NAD(P)-binding domain-containing protein [Methylomirabilota bacterium]